MMDLSQPILSANIYCEGYLDKLIHDVIAPFEVRFSPSNPSLNNFLWFVRYKRGGEHLKIRLHGNLSMRESMKADLDNCTQAFLAALPPADQAKQRNGHVDLFPIDEEDEHKTLYPDRTLVWTRYRRLPGTMGRQPMSDDLEHAALFYRCLGIGSAIVLRNFKPDSSGTIKRSLRTSIALSLFTTLLAAFDRTLEERVEYLRYHRDWLFTSFNINPERACDHFDRKIRSQSGVLKSLRPMLHPTKGTAGEKMRKDDLWGQWQYCSRQLLLYALSRVESTNLLKDPFTKDQVLSTPYNLLHTHANQLALGILEECYLFQLLYRACEEI